MCVIATGGFVEGNPMAAVGMGWLGLSGYLALTSLFCLFLATVSTGRPCGPVARVAVGFLMLVCAGKVVMVDLGGGWFEIQDKDDPSSAIRFRGRSTPSTR